MSRLIGAIQFLTVIPLPAKGASLARSALFFPLVGAGIGALASVVYRLLDRILPATIASIGVVLFLVAITGGLHEDGLADAADALRSGRSPEKILDIMRDSRIGSYGALALVISNLVRWQALVLLGPDSTPALVVSEALPRTAVVVMSKMFKPVGGGLGQAMASELSRATMLVAAAQGIAFTLLLTVKLAPALLFATAFVIWLAGAFFLRRLGGVNGDCLGATGQVIECVSLLVFVWARST